MPTYRESAKELAPGSVTYTRLASPRTPSVLLALASLGLALYLMLPLFDSTEVYCSAGRACGLTQHRAWGAHTTVFQRDASVVVFRHFDSRNAEYGILVLRQVGAPTLVVYPATSYTDIRAPEAEAKARELRDRLSSGNTFTLVMSVSAAEKIALLALTLLVFLFSCISFFAAFPGVVRIRAKVLPAQNALAFGRVVFGIPFKTQSVSLNGLDEVRVESQSTDRGTSNEGLARISLVFDGGEVVHLQPKFAPGVRTHERAAAELRRLLELKPMPSDAGQKR